jgi:methionyl-tRNA synthetase
MDQQPDQPEGATPTADAAAGPRLLGIEEFMQVELRVARVVAAESVPNTDKLLRLEVDLGTERRQLVAGIAGVYEPSSLVGKTVVVVANLKPARIRGVESRGMLLAADAGDGPVVATFDVAVAPGTRVR